MAQEFGSEYDKGPRMVIDFPSTEYACNCMFYVRAPKISTLQEQLFEPPGNFFLPFSSSSRLLITQLPEQGSYPVIRGGEGGTGETNNNVKGVSWALRGVFNSSPLLSSPLLSLPLFSATPDSAFTRLERPRFQEPLMKGGCAEMG